MIFLATNDRLIEEVMRKLRNDKFIPGYLLFENSNNTNKNFSFQAQSEDNIFSLEDKRFIPTIFSEFIGNVEPVINVYIEDGNFNIVFALETDDIDKFNEDYEYIDNFRKDLSGASGTIFPGNLNYSFATSSLNKDRDNIVLNGVRVILLSLTVFYTITDGQIGNQFQIEYDQLNNGTFAPLENIGFTSSVGNSVEPIQVIDKNESGSLVIGSSLQMNISVMASSSFFITTLFRYLYDPSFEKDRIFTLRINGQYVRKMHIQSVTQNGQIGQNITYAVSFISAQEDFLNEL